MKETDNQAVERVVPLANENDVSISLTKDGKVGTERRAGMRIVDVRVENYRGVTLLHGSSRRMSNHGVFQHWG